MLRRALLFSLAACGLAAQIKRNEIVNATTLEGDAKGLSPTVPYSEAVSTQFERVVVIRFKHQADLLAGLQKHVSEMKIRNAIILSGTGSALSTHYHVVSNRSFPSKNLFVENETDSADIINLNGCVLGGKIHAHITFADGGKSYGGHLEPRTKVFTFAVVTIGVLPANIDMSRFDDKTYR